MQIVAFAHSYLPECRAGAEMMLHRLLLALLKRGHRCHVVTPRNNGIDIAVEGVSVGPSVPFAADIVIGQLAHTPDARAYADSMGAKFVQIVHNVNGQTKGLIRLPSDLIVTNTRWVKRALGLNNALVCHPPVDFREHATTHGSKVTLVNLIEAKGSELFYHLAESMPDVEFLGVIGGYGEQQIRDLPNVEIQHNTEDMKRDVWAKTAVLLMPSEVETFGMVGVEAACSGIPTIAHPTEGLYESLGHAGTFINRARPARWEKMVRRLLQGDRRVAAKLAERQRQVLDQGHVSEFCNQIEGLL